MPEQNDKPKDLPAPNPEKVTGGLKRPRSEDPDAGGEIFKKKG